MKKFFLTLLLTISIISIPAQNLELEWAKIVGDATIDPHDYVTDKKGNIYLCGEFTETNDFDSGDGSFIVTSKGGKDVFILKLDSLGNFIWAKTFGGNTNDWATSLAVDNWGNVLVTGHIYGSVEVAPGVIKGDPGTFSMFVMKLNEHGDFQWIDLIQTVSGQSGRLAVDSNGNVYLASQSSGACDLDPGFGQYIVSSIPQGWFLVKLSSTGTFIWGHAFDGNDASWVYDLSVDHKDNVVLTGEILGLIDFDPGYQVHMLRPIGYSAIYVYKLDPNANLLWVDLIEGVGDIRFPEINTDKSGNIYTTGYLYGTIDFDPGVDTFEISVESYHDAFIQKLNSEGKFVWARSIQGIADARVYASSVAVDEDKNVYLSGSFTQKADFDPSENEDVFSSHDVYGYDIFIEKLDSLGSYVWNKTIGGNGGDMGTDIFINKDGYLYSTGSINHTVDFECSDSTYTLSSFGGKSNFLQRFHFPDPVVEPEDSVKVFGIYPNPSSDIFTIDLGGEKNIKLRLFNVNGVLIMVDEIEKTSTYTIDKNLEIGMYILELQIDEETSFYKLIKSN